MDVRRGTTKKKTAANLPLYLTNGRATRRTPDVITRLAQGLDHLCVSKSLFTTGHVIAKCSFDPVSYYFLTTYCLTSATYCFTDATDWNQMKPLCSSGVVRLAVWPIRS